MSVYDLEFNKDDVLIRNIIIGVLATLHDKLCWYNKTSSTEEERVDIPFFFSTTGDERFLQDNFLQDITYDEQGNIAETVYNQIPRGIVELSGVEIDPSRLTQQFVRGTYEKETEEGVLQSYSAEFISIPLNLPMDVSILVDTTLDQFKAIESIIRNVYKDNNFEIYVGGIRLPGSFGIPDSTTLDRTIEFRSGTTDKKEIKITFSIDVMISYPVFKNAKNGFTGAENTEMFNGNRMVRVSVFNKWGVGPTGATQSVIGATGTTAVSGVYIDPTGPNGQAGSGTGPSITSNQSSTNYREDDDLPEDRPWPYGPFPK